MALDYVTTLSPEILQKAQDELGEDEERRTDNVLALREWVKKQPHLKAMPTGTPSTTILKAISYLTSHLLYSIIFYRCPLFT